MPTAQSVRVAAIASSRVRGVEDDALAGIEDEAGLRPERAAADRHADRAGHVARCVRR